MTNLLLNVAVALTAVLLILSVWVGVHLLAESRLGARILGCRGPIRKADGSSACCKDPNRPCEELDHHDTLRDADAP